MAILPMNQSVDILRHDTEPDEWGNQSISETFSLKCRIDEGVAVRSYRSVGMTSDTVLVVTARILFDKLADIRITDTVIFTNELGLTTEKNPIEINVKRGVSGVPILTEVIV
jgi:hypothetical protein